MRNLQLTIGCGEQEGSESSKYCVDLERYVQTLQCLGNEMAHRDDGLPATRSCSGPALRIGDSAEDCHSACSWIVCDDFSLSCATLHNWHGLCTVAICIAIIPIHWVDKK